VNIFVVSRTPALCARALDDQRLNKMILESAQMLCTALHIHGYEQRADLYKAAYQKHPCTVWTFQTQGNYNWHLLLFEAMLVEYSYRFAKTHAARRLLKHLRLGLLRLPAGGRQPFANCTPFKGIEAPATEEDLLMAYRNTLRGKWNAQPKAPKWTKRGPPLWRTT
jgi:Pyrimidine dimer DNA glycosylase